MLTLSITGFCLAGVSVFSLSRAKEKAQITNPSGAVSNTRVNHYLLSNLSAALMDIKDTSAIPTLERLLSSSNSRTRLGAIVALRQMHSSKGIVSLVAALDDIDRDVRYEAVMGLAELTGQDSWRPAISVFQADEQRYLDHWKAWAQTR